MKCAVPRRWDLHPCGMIAGMSLSRRVVVVLAALMTAAVWGGAIDVMCQATGYWIGSGWLAAIIVGIFALALLALSLVGGAGAVDDRRGDEGRRGPITPRH